jgi:hypothetical protein
MYRTKMTNTKREKLDNEFAKVYTTDALVYAFAYRR